MRLEHRKAKPNRFFREMSKHAVGVVLDHDVAEVFESSQDVNSSPRPHFRNEKVRSSPTPRRAFDVALAPSASPQIQTFD